MIFIMFTNSWFSRDVIAAMSVHPHKVFSLAFIRYTNMAVMPLSFWSLRNYRKPRMAKTSVMVS
jgi:hypothetical protein